MVLGITLRRKRTKEEPKIRPSPSLPNIPATGYGESWPEEWVDVSSLRAAALSEEGGAETIGRQPSKVDQVHYNNKASFQSARGGMPPSFHRPFRPPPSAPTAAAEPPGRDSIASLYASAHPPSAFQRSTTYPALHTVPSTRRIIRSPTTFNIMVAGARGSGKTSLLRLLLDTCDVSPTATDEQRTSLMAFAQGYEKRTKVFRKASIEIWEERHEKMLLTLIDTPGLDFGEGRDLELERGAQNMVKYLDTQFAETMDEESKVIRKSKEGDQHVHLIIYLIDPDSIMSPAARRAKSSLPTGILSQSTVTQRASLSSINSEATSVTSVEEVDPNEQETLSPADIRVMKRLDAKSNILPIIARADTLSDERLSLVKGVLTRDLLEAGLGFGVFADSQEVLASNASTPTNGTESGNIAQEYQERNGSNEEKVAEPVEEEEERSSRPVIKIRSTRRFFRSERSKSRTKRLLGLDEDEPRKVPPPVAVGAGDRTGAFDTSAPPTPSAWSSVSKTDIPGLLPFAILSPTWDPAATKRAKKRQAAGEASGEPQSEPMTPLSPVDPNQITQTVDPFAAETSRAGARPPGGRPIRKSSMANLKVRTVEDLKGKFMRKYRWGTIDVLDQHHCDFVAMRTAILGTHMKLLKNNTKEVLYEKFRTEKLLARRATRNITDEDRKKFLQDLGI